MQTQAQAMRALTVIGLVGSLTACGPDLSQAPVLEALRAPLAGLAVEVRRVDDDALTSAFRDVAATWEAGAAI